MRILHLDTDDLDNPLSGGGPKKNYEIYKRISARHEITVLTATFPGSKKEVIRDGIRYVRLGKGNKHFGLSYHFSYLASLPFAIKQFPHDLLIEEFMAPCGGIGSFLWTKKPVISSIQWFFSKAWSKKYKLPFQMGEWFSLKIYKKFIVQSLCLKEKISRINPNAITKIIYPGIERSFLEVPPQKGEYVLFIGRIEIMQKGLDILIRTFYKTRNQHPYKLFIAGDGYDMSTLKSMVNSLGLTSRVEFLGKVTDDGDKSRLFSGAKVVCMPSRYETFGMVALEAFAFGKPVLCFDIPALNELVDSQRGELVTPFDENLYAQKLTHLLLNEENCEKNILSRRKFAGNFTWEKIANEQENFYKMCLEKE